MTPSCLRVERAIIFFISFSVMAEMLAINIVREAVRRIRGLNRGIVFSEGKNRIRRNTPAVTRVEEWTKADTGVGAAMAAGSQEENGSWALLVSAATATAVRSRGLKVNWWGVVMVHIPWLKDQAILRRIRTSPMRLVKAVSMPPARALGVW